MGHYSDSTYGIFIIESMDSQNEQKGKLDGQTLKHILDLCDIPCKYYYIRTKLELERVMEEFDDSNYRFLHLSCHANNTGIALTYENLDFDELDQIMGEFLYHRRLFLSACSVAVFEFAEHFIPKYHCFSVIGTPDDIDYDKSAVFWSSFYYLMYSTDSEQMVQKKILPTLLKVSDTFAVNLNYFSIINDANKSSIDHLKEFVIVAGDYTASVRKTQFRNRFRTEGDALHHSDSSDSS